jgi:hypothetical protein
MKQRRGAVRKAADERQMQQLQRDNARLRHKFKRAEPTHRRSKNSTKATTPCNARQDGSA